jgi:catechol 2,3-dioxygenase-like lactoylglutathione lyase family enzyme
MDDRPVLDQVNLVVDDMEASVRFYRGLGLDVPDTRPEEHGIAHAAIPVGGAIQLDLDNLTLAHVYNADWRRPEGPSARVVLGFRVASREAVDERYAALTTMGARGVQPPYDAFWGSRYAIVADPDGNHVGLASPRDHSRSRWPDGGESPAP